MGDDIVKQEDKLTLFKRSIQSEKAMAAIANALPEHLNAKKMARVVITAVTRTPKLLDCNPITVMNAVIEASQLGLMVDGVLGHGYLVPYKSTCVFIPGYRGLLDLARRSGEIAWVNARVVHENDEFDYGYGMDPRLNHTPARSLGKEPGPMIAAYGIAKYKDDEFHFEVMHKDEIEAIRKRSRAGNDGPWVTDYDEMARKTVIRRLCKYLPMNPEYQNLVTRDEYHEAGVLEQYIDVDPKTGEVIDAEAKQTGDMLDMFAEKLEGEEEISDPRFEGEDDDGGEGVEDKPSTEPDAEPDPQQPDDEGDGDRVAEAEPPAVVNDNADGPTTEAADEVNDPGDDGDLKQDGSGRISKEEDSAFLVALANLKERMRKVQDDDAIDKLTNNRLGMFGAEKPIEIRARHDRVKFYNELKQMCEQWESYAKPAMD